MRFGVVHRDFHKKMNSVLANRFGISLIITGATLLAVVSTYYIYSLWADSRLDRLNVSVDLMTQKQQEMSVRAGIYQSSVPSDPSPVSPIGFTTDEIVGQKSPSIIAIYKALPPGNYIHPKYWNQPMFAGTDYRETNYLPNGFTSVSEGRIHSIPSSVAIGMKIPVIDVNSTVSELSIIDYGDSQAYETPKNTVGHIPETVNPGQIGNAWYFGHLESPIRGEGNVFAQLPRIAEHLKEGDPLHIVLETENGEYLYQVISSRVVHQDDLVLYGSDQAIITLVACVPKLVYDHRLLVTAKLVGARP